MNYINAFWVGGLICALTQILMEKTKLMPGRIMVLLVCSGAVLGAAGIYEPLLDYAKAGASVPLLGFGNVLWEGVHDAVQEEGLLGISKVVSLPVLQEPVPLWSSVISPVWSLIPR